MTTPDISHIKFADYDVIYEPAEDSFLFLDALLQDLKFIRELRPSVCLEIGSGSGIVSTFLAKELDFPVLSICTDINPHAVEVTRKTGQQNGIPLEAILTDLVNGLSERLRSSVDILLFNPPYVVTPSEEVGSHGIKASWAGGKNGREVIDRVLPLVPHLLSHKGAFYMVVIKENKPDEISAILAKSGFTMETLLSRRSGPEFLSILRFTRTTDI